MVVLHVVLAEQNVARAADRLHVTPSAVSNALARLRHALAYLRVVGIDALVSLGDLGSSEIDLHVGIPGKGPGLHVDPSFEERNVLVARRGRVAAGKLSRRALGKLRHVRVEMVPGRRFGDPFAAMFAQANVPREIVMTVPSFSAAAEVVAASDLVTMLPSSLLAAKGPSLGLRALATPLPPHTTKQAMSWHERTHADPAAHAFRALVRSTIAT